MRMSFRAYQSKSTTLGWIELAWSGTGNNALQYSYKFQPVIISRSSGSVVLNIVRTHYGVHTGTEIDIIQAKTVPEFVSKHSGEIKMIVLHKKACIKIGSEFEI